MKVIALIASELSTPINVIEAWPLEKGLMYYEAAIDLIAARNGHGQEAEEPKGEIAEKIEEALGFKL